MRWQRVTIAIPGQWQDAAIALCLDAGSGGAWVEDEGAQARVHCFFTAVPDLDGIGRSLRQISDDVSIDVSTVDDEQWRDAHRQFFRPLWIGRRLAVVPAWDTDHDAGDRLVIRVDPGLAFGTGQHPTTVMMLQELDCVLRRGDRVLDIGTGSGILAIAADLLGAGAVTAIDNDDEAVRCSRVNCPCHVRVAAFDLAALDSGWGPFDLILSNLTADLLIPLAEVCGDLLASGGMWILGGIGQLRLVPVLAALDQTGWRILRRRDADGWVTIVAIEGGEAGAPAGDRS